MAREEEGAVAAKETAQVRQRRLQRPNSEKRGSPDAAPGWYEETIHAAGSHLPRQELGDTQQDSNLGDNRGLGRTAMAELDLEGGTRALTPKPNGNLPYCERIIQRSREKRSDMPKDMREVPIVSTYPRGDIPGRMEELLRAEGLEHIERPQHGMESPHLLLIRNQLTLISETQGLPTNKHQGKVFNDILASIGLDSPTSAHETRSDGEISRHDSKDHRISTPIRNSASSLLALGKQVLTPRQGRSWTYGNKSPLGG